MRASLSNPTTVCDFPVTEGLENSRGDSRACSACTIHEDPRVRGNITAFVNGFGQLVDWNAGRTIEMAEPELEARPYVDHEVDRFATE